MKKIIAGTAGALWLILAVPAFADSMAEAATGLCEMVKECSLAQIKKEDLTPELMQMMEPMLANMCANISLHAQYGSRGLCGDAGSGRL
jgi:hypothetical protein